MNNPVVVISCFLVLFSSLVVAKESICYGTSKHGRLVNGVKLPDAGSNFISYGNFPEIAGRTYVHSTVKKVVVEAYSDLLLSMPGKVFKYAETGFKTGGKFKPHKTHQNGLSIDFMVPVIDGDGKSVHFPTNMFNKYGYNVEFNSAGEFDKYRIDFAALGAHIVALHKAALKNDIEIWRVLFAPDLQPALYATEYGEYLKNNIFIPGKQSWVRHDEHYHVDFKVSCKPM